MAAGVTYDNLATTTLGSTTDSVTFSSFPSTYTDLIIIGSCRDGSTSFYDAQCGVRFNSDTGANYSNRRLAADKTTVNTYGNTNANYALLGDIPNQTSGYSANTWGTLEFQIFNYANTSMNKTALGRSAGIFDGTNTRVYSVVGMWRNTSAITSITIYTNSGVGFVSGSVFTLYGVTAA